MFNFSSSEGIKLTPQEERILEAVDNFRTRRLKGYHCLGELHNTIRVELQYERPDRINTITFSREEIEKHIEHIEKMLRQDAPIDRERLYVQLEYLHGVLNRMNPESDNITIEHRIEILGEYKRTKLGDTPTVVLYMRPIRNRAMAEKVLAETYVHEMYHAYYDHNKTVENRSIPEVEEPLTELGMLRFMQDFEPSCSYSDIDQHAFRSVKSKQYHAQLCHYGFGAYLFDNPNVNNMAWEDAFSQVKYDLSLTDALLSQFVSAFSKGLYPLDEYHYAKLLWNILGPKAVTKLPLSNYSGALFSFRVAGLMHQDSEGIYRAHELRRLSVGDELQAELDLTNPYDPNAVRLLDEDGREVGFIPKGLTLIPRTLLRNGAPIHFVISGIEAEGAYNKRFVEVEIMI